MREIARILLVDDDEDFVLLLKTALDIAGFKGQVSVAAEPRTAMEQFNGRKVRKFPDLVLVDLQLHHGSGFELLRSIRSRPELNDIPVRMLTGLEVEGDAHKAFELGAQEFLVKPLEFSRLVELADHLCSPHTEHTLA